MPDRIGWSQSGIITSTYPALKDHLARGGGGGGGCNLADVIPVLWFRVTGLVVAPVGLGEAEFTGVATLIGPAGGGIHLFESIVQTVLILLERSGESHLMVWNIF